MVLDVVIIHAQEDEAVAVALCRQLEHLELHCGVYPTGALALPRALMFGGPRAAVLLLRRQSASLVLATKRTAEGLEIPAVPVWLEEPPPDWSDSPNQICAFDFVEEKRWHSVAAELALFLKNAPAVPDKLNRAPRCQMSYQREASDPPVAACSPPPGDKPRPALPTAELLAASRQNRRARELEAIPRRIQIPVSSSPIGAPASSPIEFRAYSIGQMPRDNHNRSESRDTPYRSESRDNHYRVEATRTGWLSTLAEFCFDTVPALVIRPVRRAREWIKSKHKTAPAPQKHAAPQPPTADCVDVSAFAPMHAVPGAQFITQVFLHQVEHVSRVDLMAKATDVDTALRSSSTLEVRVAREKEVIVELECRDLVVESPRQKLIWRGGPRAVLFIVSVPDEAATRAYPLRARIWVDGVPVGAVCFSIKITPVDVPSEPAIRGESAKRYERVFLSYAKEDRPEVLKRTEGLSAAGITFFHDILSLDPGEQWERRLYEEIDKCDLFLLFWSSHAARSEWVIKEADRALQRQEMPPGGAPDITPIILERPPVPQPPESLKHLHFNSMMRYLIAAAEAERGRPPLKA